MGADGLQDAGQIRGRGIEGGLDKRKRELIRVLRGHSGVNCVWEIAQRTSSRSIASLRREDRAI